MINEFFYYYAVNSIMICIHLIKFTSLVDLFKYIQKKIRSLLKSNIFKNILSTEQFHISHYDKFNTEY